MSSAKDISPVVNGAASVFIPISLFLRAVYSIMTALALPRSFILPHPIWRVLQQLVSDPPRGGGDGAQHKGRPAGSSLKRVLSSKSLQLFFPSCPKVTIPPPSCLSVHPHMPPLEVSKIRSCPEGVHGGAGEVLNGLGWCGMEIAGEVDALVHVSRSTSPHSSHTSPQTDIL